MRRLQILSAVLVAASLYGQQIGPLSIRSQVAGTVQQLADNATVTFASDGINRPLDGVLSVTNRGAGQISINRVELTGSTDFSVGSVPDSASVFGVNDGFALSVRFRPSSGLRVSGTLRITYMENPNTTRPTTGTATINLAGIAPDFVLAYLPPPSANATPIQTGGTIAFPNTAVNETSNAVVVITNRGSGPGSVGTIASTGNAAFSLAALPSPPTTVEANRDVRFSIRYAPTVLETSTGAVSIELVDRTVTLNITGASTGALFGYDLVLGSAANPLRPGAPVQVPDIAVGEKSTATVRVRNNGNADGRITAIGVQGAGFAITDAPFLPAVLTPGAVASVTITFTPTTPGRFTGRLRVGDDSFDVVSNGLGPNLNYSFVAGPVTTTVAGNGSVIFPPAAVGQTSTVRFVVSNTGTSPAAVNSVGVVSTGTTFAAGMVPRLPATLNPGETFEFTLVFTPAATGTLTGTLRVDSQTFSLSGLATAPPAIPAYAFSGATGAQQPGQQLAVGLALAQTYPLTLRGTLNLGFNSDVFANDPAVQFAIGGRAANFTIPAGTREAVFSTGQNQIRLQTGTVAGSIQLTPSFQSDGGIALTPTDPPSLNLTVAQAAPRLLTVQTTSRTTTGFQLLVTGFATSRQISTIELAFTPVSGENVSTQRLSIPADASFTAWYQSATSVPFGSQFTATIPIILAGDLVNVTSLAETVKSVSVTLTNRAGSSSAVSVDIN